MPEDMTEAHNKIAGTLYLVPTPIGNLSDMSERAIGVLKDSKLIACEDTRVSGRLLKYFNISARTISYHDFNEQSRSPKLIQVLLNGENVSVITDAGSPGISDPAYRIIRAAIDNNIVVCPLPGPTAIIPALTGSGLPTDRFFFEGFLPPKSGSRRNRLKKLIDLEHTLVIYESPHRIAKTIKDCYDVLGDRDACIAREISKIHEEFIRDSLSGLLQSVQSRQLKGEIVLVVAGCGKKK